MAAADVAVSFLVLVGIYAILAMGLNVKYGHTGLLDFGHVGFYLIGAYTATFFVLPPDNPADFTVYLIGLKNVPFVGNWIVGIAAATLLAGLIGGLVALPTIRLREDYLAITVLGISVIFQRIIQSETWLANGPDALRGYSPPLQDYFPLLMDTLVGPVLFGLVVAVVWSVATILLARESERDSRLPLDTILLMTSFGLSSRSGEGLFQDDIRVGVAAGILAAVLTVIVLAVVNPILYLSIAISLYTWFVLGVVIAHRYGHLGVREWLTGMVLGTASMVALVPLAMIADLSVKVAVTLVALGVLAVVYYYAATNVEWFGETQLTVIAVGSLWFIGLWYFVLPILGPLGSGELGTVLERLFQNVVWIVRFGRDVGINYTVAVIGSLTIQVDYSRFLMAGFMLFMAGLYYVLQLTVLSPFGRVLRAVRNDEQVVESLGKDPFVYKVQSMVIGSAMGGFAGALWAMYSQGLTFTTFAPRVTFITLLILFIGGAGNNKGMLLGAGIFWAFQQATTQLAGYFPPAVRVNVQAFRLVLMGVLFLIILYYMPQGLMGREDYRTEVDNE